MEGKIREKLIGADDSLAQHASDPLPRWLAETAFAASYFLKEFDLVPALILQQADRAKPLRAIG